MDAPGIPANEAARLLALHGYAVLDTQAEAAFDDLARLAAFVAGTPIALVSLVDADRQWFKARYGLDAPETPRDVSFCGHAVIAERMLIVSDAHADPRFADNPLVTGEPRVRFYAGMPLRTPDGFVLGTVCAIDHVVRQLSAKQLEMLGVIAAQVVDQLEARRGRLALAREREEARAATERLATVFAAMAEGVVVQDATGQIREANPAAEAILGLTGDELRGRSSVDPRWHTVHEDGRAFPGEGHPAMVSLRTGQAQSGVVMGVCKPSGALTWISINARPRVADGQVIEVVSTFADVTAARAAVVRATEQDRLATVGTLAAGVGHEINNPLTYLLGNLDVAVEEVRSIAGPSPALRLRELTDTLTEAREGADRIRKIVRGLRALAREDVALQGIDLAGVIDTSLSMAAHEIKHKATVVTRLGPIPPVLADESRLTQVVVNLAMNAAQAFERGDPQRNRIVISAELAADGRVIVSVADNGPGIPAAIVARIFDPFFTTKPSGQGTGLGLPVSRALVAALGGELQVTSVEGQGATFQFTLAAVRPVEPEEARRAEVARARILVIDDEVAVANTIRRILAREHDVVTSSDPRAALAMIEAGDRFDVVVCDLMMPHLSGDELFARVRELRPALAERFVFVTGGATNPAARAFLAEIGNPRLEKPFATPELLALVRGIVTPSAA